MKTSVDYGKLNVTVYRTHAAPLHVAPILESTFSGRDNALFACAVDLDVLGDAFLASYTEGDNRAVVATDSLRNFVHAMALEFDGATLEAFLAFLGLRLLATYPQMAGLRLRAREIPFVAAKGPRGAARGTLFGRSRADVAVAEMDVTRADGNVAVTAHRSGREGLQLAKLQGSSFAGFVRDEYTTLAETIDRPLYLHLAAHWRYSDVKDAVDVERSRYVAAEQVRDILATVFDEFESRSIQHLVHEMGLRLLARFPQLVEVRLEGQNRIWDTARTSERDPRVKVYTDPRPAYGRIGLTLRR